MDILHLIDRLEEELSRGRRLPFTSIVMLNEQRLWNVIDTMRISIPKEVEEAQAVNRERERMLAQAREEAGRIVDLTRKRAEEITSSHELIRSARAEAAEIVSRAQHEAQRFHDEADSYAMQVLSQLEDQLNQVLHTVQSGVQVLSGENKSGVDSEGEA